MYKATYYFVFLILTIISLALTLYGLSNYLDFTVTWQYVNISEEKTIGFLELVLFGAFSLYLGTAFHSDGILKYKTSEICGIIGIISGCTSLSVMILFPSFSWALLISGILCLYAALAPIINEINKRMNSWEKGTISATLAFFILYYLNYQSNILINGVFSVDPKHFPFTRIVSAFIVASPLLFLISFITLIIIFIMLFMKSNSNKKNTFFLLCAAFAALTTFLFSTPLINNGKNIIKSAASIVDFNSKSICINVKNNVGVIFLNDRYDLILTDNVNNKKHSYEVKTCQLSN
jgi:hypothetical protein